jgi:uncharacterized membrane protein YkoI
MRKKLIAGAAALAAAGLVTGVAAASGGSSSAGPSGGGSTSAGASRLDDGKDLLPQAGITEQQAVDAARATGSGAIGEVDLEHYQGKLVFNVDVGNRDVKVDAGSGDVLASDQDD